jgi:hypothetical protein
MSEYDTYMMIEEYVWFIQFILQMLGLDIEFF